MRAASLFVVDEIAVVADKVQKWREANAQRLRNDDDADMLGAISALSLTEEEALPKKIHHKENAIDARALRRIKSVGDMHSDIDEEE